MSVPKNEFRDYNRSDMMFNIPNSIEIMEIINDVIYSYGIIAKQ